MIALLHSLINPSPSLPTPTRFPRRPFLPQRSPFPPQHHSWIGSLWSGIGSWIDSNSILATIVLVVLAGLFSGVNSAHQQRQDGESESLDPTLEQQPEWLAQTARESAGRLKELEAEIEARAVRAEKLKQQVEDAERLSAGRLKELEAEIEARAVQAEKLKQQVEDAERLAQLTEDDQQAVARTVDRIVSAEGQKREGQRRAELARTNRHSFWQDIAVNVGVGLLFFIAGLVASIWLR